MVQKIRVEGDIHPKKVTQVYQVSIPAKLLRQVGLDKGSPVSCALSKDLPNTILLFPSDRVSVDGAE